MGLIGALVLFLIFAIVLKKYVKSLIGDYVADGALSFADNFLFGAGAVGLDVGDWVGAIILFKTEKKICGTPVALFVAWEATNFLPISLIPVVGEVVEVIFNLFPAATIGRMMYSKEKDAKKAEKKYEDNIEAAKTLGIGTWFKKGEIKKLKKLEKHEDFVNEVKRGKKDNEKFSKELRSSVEKLNSETSKQIKELINSGIQAPPNLVNILHEGINNTEKKIKEARSAEDDKDFKTAAKAAKEAKDILKEAIGKFNSGMNNS